MAPAMFFIATVLATASAVFVSAPVDEETRTAPARPATLCGRAAEHSVERQYVVSARIRPLLIWFGRTEVGAARIGWAQAGLNRRLELLIGTDPERTPMRVNRWGYIQEEVCGDRTALVGVMTESSEKTIDEASSQVQRTSGTRTLRAIRGTVTAQESRAEVLRLDVDPKVTYRDLEALLTRLPASGVARHTTVAPGTSPGFLHAMAALLRESTAGLRQSGRASAALRRPYVYGDRTFDLTLQSATVRRAITVGTTTHPQAVDAAFEVRSRQTGEVTAFSMTFVTDDPGGEVPVRVLYRPRWWLELELQLAPAPVR